MATNSEAFFYFYQGDVDLKPVSTLTLKYKCIGAYCYCHLCDKLVKSRMTRMLPREGEFVSK